VLTITELLRKRFFETVAIAVEVVARRVVARRISSERQLLR